MFKFDPKTATVASRVTLPLLKQKVGNPIFVYFLKPHAPGELRDGDTQPPTLAHVIDLTTGDESEIILTVVTKKKLDECYKQDGYVGRAFKIELHAVEGKKYHSPDIAELTLDNDQKTWLDSVRAKVTGTNPAEMQQEKAEENRSVKKEAGK